MKLIPPARQAERHDAILKDIHYISGSLSPAETAAAQAHFQARADEVLELHGQKAPPPYPAEGLGNYRRRLLSYVQPHCAAPFNQIDVNAIADSALPPIERKMIADSIAEFKKPEGALREVVTRDPSGREIHEFYGDPENTWRDFKATPRIVTEWTTPRGADAAGAVSGYLMPDGNFVANAGG
jgi:hypothetical protein